VVESKLQDLSLVRGIPLPSLRESRIAPRRKEEEEASDILTLLEFEH